MPELNNTILKNNTNLKAYYRFESGAETTDSSGNSNTLTAIGTPTFSAGKFGQGVNYASASTQGHSITDTAILKPTGAFTIGAWIKTSTSGVTQHIFQSYSQNTAVAGINLRITSTNALRLLSGKNSGTTQNTDYQIVVGASTNLTDGNWHFVVGVWNTTTLSVYVDGKYDGAIAWANAPVYAATNYVLVGVGNSVGTGLEYFNGSIDEVFLLNGTALSADQIKELYEGRYVGEGRPEASLVAGYHLSDITDFSGNNFHLTNNNGVTFPQGKFNKCADFGNPNTTKYLSYAGNLGIAGSGAMTMHGWFRLHSITGVSIFINHSSTLTSSKWMQIYNSAGALNFDCGASGPSISGILSANIWYHIVFVRDGSGNLFGYLNGNLVGTGTAGGSSSGDHFYIGVDASTNYGEIMADEVRIYNVAKDANWVRKQYAWAKGKFL